MSGEVVTAHRTWMQRGELALAPRVGEQEAGLAGYRAAQETGSAGNTARGSSADFGWREHEECEERSCDGRSRRLHRG